MTVIFSDHFKGAGIVAGGPYNCVNNNPIKNIKTCTTEGTKINTGSLEKDTDVFSQEYDIS